MSSKVEGVTYGWVAEPHRNGVYLISPATLDQNGNCICHDPSGFAGSWKMKSGGIFYCSNNQEKALDLSDDAYQKAVDFADNKNRNLRN